MSPFEKQELLDNFGPLGQAALARSHVLLVGVGGLGCACAQQLVAMGVGRLTLVDGDQVSRSNLSRQVLYRADDVGKNKAEVASVFLSQLAPGCRIEAVPEFLSPQLCERLFLAVDLVVDASDNFETKFLVNAAAARFQKPVIWANAQKWEGQVASFDARRGPCYQCLLPNRPSNGAAGSCNEIGVLGAVPNALGVYQAVESVKALCEIFEVPKVPRPRWGELLSLSFRDLSSFKTQVKKNASCPVCSLPAHEIKLVPVSAAGCETSSAEASLPCRSIRELREGSETCFLIDVREDEERDVCAVPGAYGLALSRLRTSPDEELLAMRVKLKLDGVEHEPEPLLAFFCKSGKRSREALGILQRASKDGLPRACVLKEGAQELSET